MASEQRQIERGRRLTMGGVGAALLATVLAVFGFRSKAQETQAHSGATPPGEAELRKRKSLRRLRSEGVPTIDHLPVIETQSEARLRGAGEVAERLLALTLVAVKAEGLLSNESPESVRDTVEGAIRERKAASLFTPKEQAFVAALRPDGNDQIQFNWRYEAAWVLAWALQWIDGPLDPRRAADVPRLSGIVHDQTDLARHGLRPPGELLDEADLIYRYHWATREALLRGKPLPKGLTEDVVTERHHALNWLIGYGDEAWDDVTTDT